jgi:hypothetical protein
MFSCKENAKLNIKTLPIYLQLSTPLFQGFISFVSTSAEECYENTKFRSNLLAMICGYLAQINLSSDILYST